MSEEKSWLDEHHQESELRFGERIEPERAAQLFSLHKSEDRIKHLKRIEDSTPTDMTVNQASDYHRYIRLMRSAHERLRRLGR